MIQEGRAIGYRRLPGGKAGSWVARLHVPAHGRKHRALGSADDLTEADEHHTLTFSQAQEAAQAWFKAMLASDQLPSKPLTVAEAVASYVEDYQSRGGKALPSLLTTLKAHILPSLGSRDISALTSPEIKRWHADLARAPARLRTGGLVATQKTRAAETPEAERARRSTSNRVLTVLKAVLNHAFRDGQAANDIAWRRVRPFQRVEASRIRFLDDGEARRLVNACPTDLRQIVVAALLTGARYGELAAIRAADLDLNAATLHIPVSKGGSARHVHLTDEGAEFFRPLIAGRARSALVLTRADGLAWGKSHQHRPLQLACAAARITPTISFHILRHTYASRLARAGVSMLAIASQLGHADTRITVQHYAHLQPDHVAQAVRAGFPSMGLHRPSNVQTMKT